MNVSVVNTALPYSALVVVQPTGRTDQFACGMGLFKAVYYDIYIQVSGTERQHLCRHSHGVSTMHTFPRSARTRRLTSIAVSLAMVGVPIAPLNVQAGTEPPRHPRCCWR